MKSRKRVGKGTEFWDMLLIYMKDERWPSTTSATEQLEWKSEIRIDTDIKVLCHILFEDFFLMFRTTKKKSESSNGRDKGKNNHQSSAPYGSDIVYLRSG